MRLRITMLATALAAVGCMLVPALATAAPQHNRSLSIHATPRVVNAGDPVLIFGRLHGRSAGNQLIRLYHRINPNPRFTLIGTTRTDSAGRYEFTRAEGVVNTNRNWYVTGPIHTHSKTIHERVSALVSLVPSSNEAATRHPIVFSGHVTPDHIGSRVHLQVQRGDSDNWTTVKTARVGSGSDYQISYAWRSPGARDVRVRFDGDRRNTAAVSDTASVVIDQAQIGDFTIGTPDPIVANGASATVSGKLYQPNTTTPVPQGTQVGLYARVPGQRPYRLTQTASTDAAGGYSFTVQSSTNELYQARTLTSPPRTSAVVFLGVQDAVSMTASASTATVGQAITFSGSVAPSKAGHVIYLQKLGKDGNWHTVEVSRVTGASTFSFGWTFGTAGTKQFRARITGGPANVGGASASVPVVVSQPPLSTLPTS